jgi:hypothetical protein
MKRPSKKAWVGQTECLIKREAQVLEFKDGAENGCLEANINSPKIVIV